MPYEPPPELASLSLADIAALATARKLPPVSQWDPPKSGDSEMRIAADGRWFHQGGEITRPAMVRAFSTLLRREGDGSYWLVTPQEKLLIKVEDVPFMAVEVQHKGAGRDAGLAFRLNTDDIVIAGPDNNIMLRNYDSVDIPYLHVRSGLWARASRPLHYELIELALAESSDRPQLWSNGICFPMVPLG
jgi:uncharacterized protein